MNYLFGNHDYIERGISKNGVFYPDCFETNRAGFLSTRQKRRLIWIVGSWMALAAIDLGFLSWLIYFQVFVPIPFIATLFWGGFLVVAAIMCIFHTKAIIEDLQEGKVKTIFGQIRKYTACSNESGPSRGMRAVAYVIETGNRTFDVDKSVYDSVVDHKNYWLVYIPHSKRIVNIQSPLDADERKLATLLALQRKFNR